MKVLETLRTLFEEVVREAESNHRFQERLTRVLAEPMRPETNSTGPATKHRGRRQPAVLDPFAVLREGEHVLRARLTDLDIEQLKDIVSENRMDPSKLALKWRSPERLCELIVDTARARSAKGDVFR